MDQIEGQKLLDHAAKTDECHHFLRRTLQVVISVSLLSLFFFCYPGVFFFPYSLVHTLERKYMFIICNGILAFLAKSSSSQSLHSYSDETVVGGKFSGAVPKLAATDVVSEEQTLSPAGVSFVDEEGKEQETVEDQEADHEEQEEQDKSEDLGSSAENESKNDSDEEDNGRFSIKEEEAEEVEEATESTAGEELTTSTDELNKKFEEFIRKMKEELRIQAQQQLIKICFAFPAKSSSSQSLHSYSDETVVGGKFSGAVPKLAATDVVSEEQTLSRQSSITSPVGVSFVDEEGKQQETVEDQEADHEEQEEQDKSEDLGSSAENESKNDSDEEDNGRFSIKEEEAEEVEEATESTAGEELTTSTDELNKKFEEFIRKMKEELRIQAQQQLITTV